MSEYDTIRQHIRLIMFIALILLIIGSILFYNAYQYQQVENNIAHLQTTRGNVVFSKYNAYNTTVSTTYCKLDKNDINRCTTSTQMQTFFVIAFVYKYSIHERTYESSNDGYCNSQPTQSRIESLPVGSVVKVYYNPTNPQEAYLNVNDCPKSSPGWGLACIVSSVFCLGYVFLDEDSEIK